MNNPLFDNVEKKTGVNMDELMKVAESIQGADLRDENTVRKLIRRVARIANKRIDRQTEDQLVDTITNNPNQISMDKISRML